MSSAKKLLILAVVLAVGAAAAVSVSTRLKSQIALNMDDKMGNAITITPHTSWVGQYLSGYHATQSKDYERASQFFSRALNSKSNSETVQTQAMSLLLVAGKFSQAIDIAKDLNAKSDNGLAKLTLIVDAIQRDDLKEAEKLVSDKKEDNSTIINHVIEAWVKYGEGKSEEAKAILKALQSDEVFLPFVNYNYAMISELSGDKKTAKQLFDSLIQSNQLPNGMVSAAYDFYSSENDSAKLELIKNKYSYDGSVKKHPAVTNVKEGVAEALLGVGGIIMSEYSPDKSAALFRLSLYLNPKLDDAKLLLGSILMNEGDYKGANDILSGIGTDSYLGDYAKLAIAKNFEAMDQDSKAKEYFDKLTQNKDIAIDAYVSLGDLSRKKEKYDEAADYYTKSIEAGKQQSKNGKLDSKYWAVYFARGVCYERLKDTAKSEADLMMALQLQPNQPDVMNYLAYTWIDVGKNLDKAKNMVLKAHQEKPEDPQIIDSVGWAYFKLGNFDNSVSYLEDAASLLPYDPVVNDHLGDAYWHTGRKNEARFQWERALRNNPDSKLEDELKKKLENGISSYGDATHDNNGQVLGDAR